MCGGIVYEITENITAMLIIFFVLLIGSAFSNYQIVHGLPSSLSHPNTLSVGVQGTRML